MVKRLKAIGVLAGIFFALCCSTRQTYVNSVGDPSVTRSDAININTASREDLEKLPYVGRKTAETIVDFREQNGPFRRVEHLMQIRGISEERFLELRPYIKAE